MSKEAILRVMEVSKAFGGVKAVDNVSFELARGEIMGIIGPNGSGKTTLINLITGFVRKDNGQVFFKDKNISKSSPHRIADLGVRAGQQDPFSQSLRALLLVHRRHGHAHGQSGG